MGTFRGKPIKEIYLKRKDPPKKRGPKTRYTIHNHEDRLKKLIAAQVIAEFI